MKHLKAKYYQILIILFASSTIYTQIESYKFIEEKFGLSNSVLIDDIKKVENDIYITSNNLKDLWVFNSLTEETILIYSGDNSVFPGNFTRLNESTYFTLLCDEGLSLMKTQNAIESTKRIHQFDTEFFDSDFELFIYANKLYLIEDFNTIFYILDEENETVEKIFDLSDWDDDGRHFGNRLLELNNQLLIKGNIEGEDVLWKVVEFPLNRIELITDENENPIKGIKRTLLFEDKLYFSSDTDEERKSWYYDGSGTSAKLFKEAEILNTQDNETLNSPFIILDMSDDLHRSEPWIFDGTITGTFLLKDISQSGSSRPSHFRFLDGKINFRTFETNPTTFQKWETDGTIEGTVAVSDYEPGTVSKVIGNRQFELIQINDNEIVLSEYLGGGNSVEYIRENGTLVGGVNQFSSINDEIFFFHFRDSQYSNWVSDGTIENTQELTGLNSERLRFKFSNGGSEYFSISSGNPNNLIFRGSHDSINFNTPILFEDTDALHINICDKTTNIEIIDSNTDYFYPNPTTGFLVINIDNLDSKSINIYDSRGVWVYSGTNEKKDLNVNFLIPGLYILQVKSNKGVLEHIFKFIKH